MWKCMTMMTKLKKKLRMEEETDILETEEKLSKQKLRQAMKSKENTWGIFSSATTGRTVIDLGEFTENTVF